MHPLRYAGETPTCSMNTLTRSLVDVLGSVAFTPVKSDMLGNVKVGIDNTTIRNRLTG